MKLKARYPAAALLVISVGSFMYWAFSNWALVNVGLDLKYLESETDIHLARQADWTLIRSRTGWTFLISATALSILLTYRWFVRPIRG
ncbi:MAG: hypothetical protein IPM46_12250 [Flavobacteriales bacterium]|nr:hypothetical protein [Flavobacteriales bacterium]